MIANLAVKRGVTAKNADSKREPAEMSRPPLRILILDDEWLNADLIAMMVEDCGSNVIGVAHTTSAATDLAATSLPELALVDVQLGRGPDGITCAEQLRERHGTLIAFMTGAGDAATLRRIDKFRPFATMLKPFTATQLQDILDRAADLV